MRHKIKHTSSIFNFDVNGKKMVVVMQGVHGNLHSRVYDSEKKLVFNRGHGCGHATKSTAELTIREYLNQKQNG